MQSWTPPTAEQVDAVIARIGHAEQYRHFFERNNNPLWLRPLAERGIFKTPPEPVQVDWSSSPLHAVWPASRYLVRMTEHDPQAVLDIVRAMPDTGNLTMRRDIVDVALAMPGRVAAQLVSRMVPWLREVNDATESFFSLSDGLGRLVAHLAREGETQSALRIAKDLLVVSATQTPGDPGSYVPHNRRVKARCSSWEYGQILTRDVPVLVHHAGLPAVRILIKQLKSAVWIVRNSGGRPEPDYSMIWRPTIEPHEQNLAHNDDVTDQLISALRDAVSTLVTDGTLSLREATELLEKESDPVLSRIAVSVLWTHGEQDLELVVRYLTDRALFVDVVLHHEYALLLASYFPRLSDESKGTLLRWIAAGPDCVQIASRIEQAREAAADEEMDQAVRHWQLGKLAVICQALPLEWESRYQQLVSEFGEPKHPEFLSYTEVRMGEESPMTVADLQSMSPQEIAAAVRDWRPGHDPFGPSVEGLAHALGELARTRPDEMSSHAPLFIRTAPPYVRHLLNGLREAVAQGQSIDWASVLNLCRWVVREPRDSKGILLGPMLDPDWGWVRAGIAHLLYVGLDTGQSEIPLALRDRVWEVLRPLTLDPDPQPEQDAAREGSSLQNLSINSIRGEALHAVIKYGLWLRSHMEERGENERLAAGFAEMPEVREVLDYHLDIARDRSLAIRTMYGQWLPWLILLDTAWVERVLPLIFPEAPDEATYWRAAWKTYVTMSPPYDATFELIRHVYSRAVDAIATSGDQEDDPNQADQRLAEHLMVYYWRGRISMSESDILDRFFRNARDELRGHAIEYVGHRLHQSKVPVPAIVLERLERLWESRVAEGRHDGSNHRRELGAFSWWAAADVFDQHWVLAQLRSAIELNIALDVPDLVVEYLAKTAHLEPGESLLLLRQMLGPADDWSIRRWIPGMRTIFVAALNSPDEGVSAQASSTIHDVGRRGHHAFRDLLPV